MLLVMLPEQVFTEVALQVAHDAVDMVSAVLCVVILDQEVRCLDSVVVSLARLERSGPGTEAGFEVASVTGLRCPSATAIAKVTPKMLTPVVESLDGPDVDAIVQVGTNLSFVHQAAQLEHELGKPVLAINVATLWHALRATGIDDQITGFGRILAEH